MKIECISENRVNVSFNLTVASLQRRGYMVNRQDVIDLVNTYQEAVGLGVGELDEPLRIESMNHEDWGRRLRFVEPSYVAFAMDIQQTRALGRGEGVRLHASIRPQGPKAAVLQRMIKNGDDFDLKPRLVRNAEGVLEILAFDMVDA